MKASTAIRMLEELDPDDEIILKFWENEVAPSIPANEWPAAVKHVEKEMDWSYATETILELAEEV